MAFFYSIPGSHQTGLKLRKLSQTGFCCGRCVCMLSALCVLCVVCPLCVCVRIEASGGVNPFVLKNVCMLEAVCMCVFFAEANNKASVAEDTRKIRGRCLLEGALIWDQYREQHWELHWRQYRQHHREQGTPNPGRPTIIQSNQDHQLFVLARKARASASARLRSHPRQPVWRLRFP